MLCVIRPGMYSVLVCYSLFLVHNDIDCCARSRSSCRSPLSGRCFQVWAVQEPYHGHAKAQARAPSCARALNARTRPVVTFRNGACVNRGPLSHENWDCARPPGSNRTGIEIMYRSCVCATIINLHKVASIPRSIRVRLAKITIPTR